MSDPALHTLLDHSLRLPPEYRDGLTSHLPMALQALHALGADDAALHRFFASYTRHFTADARASLPPAPPVPPVPHAAAAASCQPPSDWAPLRGQRTAWPALVAAFSAQVAAQGATHTLRQALPLLWPGVAASALHGVIRTAHALQSGHTMELAHALAYWAWRWQPLAAPAPAAAGAQMSVSDWTTTLATQADGWQGSGACITPRMLQAQHAAPYQALAGQLAPTAHTLQGLARFAALRYAQTRNFTLLHLVTGCRAVAVLLPLADDPAAAANHVVHAYTAAYLASGAGSSQPCAWPDAPQPQADWPTVLRHAVRCDDDHSIKLVHACREHAAADATADAVWLQAAAQSLKP